jgi:hypothetical protein
MLLPTNKKGNWDELGLGAWWITIIIVNADREDSASR